jgi:hypothetical protein
MPVGKICLALILAALIIAAAILLSHPETLTAVGNFPYREAQEAVKATLYRPDSAQFRAMSVHRVTSNDPGTYCGEVNAQNGFGLYTGFQPFSASRRTGQWVATIIPTTLPAKERAAILGMHALLCGQNATGTGA